MVNPKRVEARSQVIDRVSEMTSINRIKQGYTTPVTTQLMQDHPDLVSYLAPMLPALIDVMGPPPTGPIRYVDNLRWMLAIVGVTAGSGQPQPLNDVATIHYARWVILPGDEQLLFTSNFDGGFEQYIHDFVKIANGAKKTAHNPFQLPFMDLIWDNCVDYPGAEPFDAFLAYIQESMVPTTLFFSTLPSTTVRDVAWLRRFRFLFEEFDEAAHGVPRDQWPPQLLEAYERLKREINTIDVTVV